MVLSLLVVEFNEVRMHTIWRKNNYALW